jgi:TRAP-type C4-dicarboxylate transport system substrate-binding protein
MNKKWFLVILAVLMVLMSACGGSGTVSTTTTSPASAGAENVTEPAGAAAAGVPELNAAAAKRAEEAYAFAAELDRQASAYDVSQAEHRYILNNHDPAASAVGEFLEAWSDAVLVATEGKVYIEVGHSNAFSTSGTMSTLDEMSSGSIDFDFTLPCYFKGYMPLTLAIQNPGLGIKNATVAASVMWELYKNNPEIQAEYADDGEALFVWANNPSPLSYKGTAEVSDISDIKGNIRGNNGPAQLFITQVGASVFGCPIGDVYTNVSTGVIDYLITDWHGIASFSLYDEGVLNYYLDTNIGCSAYTLMANDAIWAEIERNGYADAIKAVSGDYLLNLVGIWEAYEANGRELAKSTGGTIYPPNSTLAGQLEEVYATVAEQWISDTGGSAQQVYDQAAALVDKYSALYK